MRLEIKELVDQIYVVAVREKHLVRGLVTISKQGLGPWQGVQIARERIFDICVADEPSIRYDPSLLALPRVHDLSVRSVEYGHRSMHEIALPLNAPLVLKMNQRSSALCPPIFSHLLVTRRRGEAVRT